MAYHVYILQSAKHRHYIGFTSNLEQRMGQHNRKHKGYTYSLTDEWEIIISYEVKTKEEAMELEKKLKSFKNYQKAIKYLERLNIEVAQG